MSEAITTESTHAGMTYLPLSRITSGDNPRRYFSSEKHAELVASIRQRGLLQPILLRPTADPSLFKIVAGERRYKAAIEVFGADGEVPVAIREMSDREALEAAIDENDNRDDASETEQADAAVRVLAACAGDRAEAAGRLGWSQSKFDRRLALASLSEAVKSALDERRIKVGHAELLAAVPADKQDRALETILTAALDVGKTRELLMRVTQALAAATFDKTECATCQFNSARQCALFETHVDDGHCTNTGCFELKTEAAEKARTEAEASAPSHSGAASGETNPAAMPGDAGPSTPDSSPGSSPDQGSASAAPSAAKAATRPTPAPKVTAESLARRAAHHREAAWRRAVAQALENSADTLRIVDLAAAYVKGALGFEQVDELARAFEVDLRAHWQVDEAFLAQLGKDELKFIAQECGLVAHMGEKAFAALLKSPTDRIVAGMLNAPGFDWAGHLPSAMSLDGIYAPPPVGGEQAAAAVPATSEED